MKTFQGKPVIPGCGAGPALVTEMPINFTAALSSPLQLIPGRASELRDRHHDLFGKKMKDTVLVFPSCIGSTFTGMVLLQSISQGASPAAMVVRDADSLLVSGAVLAEVWFGKKMPVVECQDEAFYQAIKTGRKVEVNAETGEIKLY